MLNCDYVKIGEYPGRNSQQSWSSRPKGEFRKVIQKIRGENVELRLRQAFEKVLQNFGGKKSELQLNSFGKVWEYFWSRKGKMESRRFFVMSYTFFEAILLTCIWDQLWNCYRLLSEQNCWNAVKTSSSNNFETKNVELELKYFFEMSSEKQGKNVELRKVKIWKVFWLISIINNELRLKQNPQRSQKI